MLPWIAAYTAIVGLKCPHCGEVQARSRALKQMSCKKCRRSFTSKEGREAMRRAKGTRGI